MFYTKKVGLAQYIEQHKNDTPVSAA